MMHIKITVEQWICIATNQSIDNHVHYAQISGLPSWKILGKLPTKTVTCTNSTEIFVIVSR